MNYNKSLIWVFFLVASQLKISHNLYSQLTFNYELNLMDYISLGGMVIQSGDTTFVIGNGTDNIEYSFYDAFIAKFDTNGKLIHKVKIEGSFENFYWTGTCNKVFDLDSVLVFIMDYFKYKTDIWVVSKSSLEIIKKIEVSNGRNVGEGFWQNDVEMINDSLFAIVSAIYEIIPANSKTRDIQLSILNINSSSIHHYYFGLPFYNDYPESICWDGNKMIIGVYGFNYKSSIYQDHESLIWEIDLEGNSELKYRSLIGDISGGIYNIIPIENGKKILTSREGIYYPESKYDKYHFRPVLIQLSEDYSVDWKVSVGTKKYEIWNWVNCLIPSVEQDGYIAAGIISPFNFDDQDSVYYGAIHKGYLSKVDKQGRKLWDRIITKVDIDSLEYWHWIHDLDQSQDGGYIGCGYLHSRLLPGERTWLFKTDRHGCIVPGCHEEVSVMQLPPEEAHILIWPNPASNWLYVFQKAEERHIYHILDMNGRSIRRFEGSMADETLMIDVSGLKPGSYVLTVETASGKSGRKVFLVI